jgi:hypothetical protein
VDYVQNGESRYFTYTSFSNELEKVKLHPLTFKDICEYLEYYDENGNFDPSPDEIKYLLLMNTYGKQRIINPKDIKVNSFKLLENYCDDARRCQNIKV